MPTLRWLLSRAALPGAAAQQHDAQQEQDQGGFAGRLLRKVLVVDDEEDLAHLAGALLCSKGLEVTLAHSAMDALRILEQDEAIDAIFSDVMMPGMTGLQLADAVRELYPRVKIVLTSGYTMPALLADRQAHYLFAPKPYRIDTIMQLLRS